MSQRRASLLNPPTHTPTQHTNRFARTRPPCVLFQITSESIHLCIRLRAMPQAGIERALGALASACRSPGQFMRKPWVLPDSPASGLDAPAPDGHDLRCRSSAPLRFP